jgi:hypothetical protein
MCIRWSCGERRWRRWKRKRMSDLDKPSIFISYAHKDGLDFVRRLAFALEMYMDVFWDRRLLAGEYPLQLQNEIKNRDYFLFVMTPYSLVSEWCQKELKYAGGFEKPISLARVYSGNEAGELELTSKYTYGDFSDNFDLGFERLSMMMLGFPYLSWEYLPYETHKSLIEAAREGELPGLIVRTVAEWVIVEKLWKSIESYISSENSGGTIFIGSPRTPMGVRDQCESLLQQLTNDIIGFSLVKEAKNIVEIYIREIMELRDSEHENIGVVSAKLIYGIRQLLLIHASGKKVTTFVSIQYNFIFDIEEKLRETINIHARRSRYLY